MIKQIKKGQIYKSNNGKYIVELVLVTSKYVELFFHSFTGSDENFVLTVDTFQKLYHQ